MGAGSPGLPPGLLARAAAYLGCAPAAVSRAPGRANLIGEHTDYSLLPVLPLAIAPGTWVAGVARDTPAVAACSAQFPGAAALRRACPGQDVTAPWQRYLAGVLTQLAGLAPGRGAALYVEGDLPTAGGLSSSSSLTMGLLATLDALWGLGLDRAALVRAGVAAERAVGVESGGMDQTVIAWARAGAALRIDFSPPRTEAVPLPATLRLVVAYSGQAAPKGGAARQAYNHRVLGCRLAAALLGRALGRDPGAPPALGAVADAEGWAAALEDLPERATAHRVARELGLAPEALTRLQAGALDAQREVRVRAAARHVLGEARRVDQLQAALRGGDLPGLGQLLDASHRSLARDYGCSTGALDRLCAAMREAGALGARLTGAGFGGFAIAATVAERLPAVLAAAAAATGGPAFEVRASPGLWVTRPPR